MDWLRCRNLMWRWSLVTAALIAAFWGIWYLCAGQVPSVTEIQMYDWALTLPVAVSRWWDVLIAPIIIAALIYVPTLERGVIVKYRNEAGRLVEKEVIIKSRKRLVICTVTLTFFGSLLTAPALFSYSILLEWMILWLLAGLCLRGVYGPVTGVFYGLIGALLVGLVYGLVCGLVFASLNVVIYHLVASLVSLIRDCLGSSAGKKVCGWLSGN